MSSTGLDYIVQNAACRGAFKVDGASLTPLSAVEPSVEQGAQRTRNLWASLVPVVSDAGLMIGTRGAEQSIASARGGVIVEAKSAINLGILKAALNKQDPIQPDAGTAPDLDPGLTALWTLADWIAAIEVPRCLRVHLGAETWDVLAKQGRFSLIDATAEDLSKAILAAADAKTAIEVSYTELPDPAAPCAHDPIEIFGPDRNTTGDWRLRSDGSPVSVPTTATLPALRDIAVLGQRLTDWRQGRPFELAILRDGRTKEVIATSTETEDINVKTTAS